MCCAIAGQVMHHSAFSNKGGRNANARFAGASLATGGCETDDANMFNDSSPLPLLACRHLIELIIILTIVECSKLIQFLHLSTGSCQDRSEQRWP